MASLKALHARLVGYRMYLISALLAVPEILDSLVGFDWDSVLPESLKVYSAKIAGALMLTRLFVIPIVNRMRRDARRRRGEPEMGEV